MTTESQSSSGAGVAAILGVATLVASPCADDFAVATTFGTTHYVLRLEASGEVSIHQTLAFGHESEDFAVEPAGRFVWFMEDSGQSPATPVYRVRADFELVLGGEVSAASPEPWQVVRPPLIMPDTSDLIVHSLVPSPDPGNMLEFVALNNSLTVGARDALVDPLSLDPPLSILLGIPSQYDPFTVYTCSVLRYDPVLRQFSHFPQPPGVPCGIGDATADGRFIVTSSWLFDTGDPELAINRVLGDGHSTIANVASLEDIPGYDQPIDVEVHPTRPLAYLMGRSSIACVSFDASSGVIEGVLEVEPCTFSNDLAITPDGSMLLQSTIRFNGIAHLVPYRINSDGTIDRLNDGLAVTWNTSEMDFLPPKTPPSLPGDANVDGLVDAADVVTVVEMVQPTARLAPPLPFANADLDQDVDVDQDDLEALVQLLVGE